MGLDILRDEAGQEVAAGARVVAVQPGGPAAAAGLRPGDVITAVEGRAVTNPSDVIAAVERGGVGRSLRLTIRRAGSPLEVSVMPGDLASQGRP